MLSTKLILLFSISQQHVDQVLFRAFLSPNRDRTRIAFHSSEPTSQFQNHTAEIKQQRIRVRRESERGEEISISFSSLGAVATWPIFPGRRHRKHIYYTWAFFFFHSHEMHEMHKLMMIMMMTEGMEDSEDGISNLNFKYHINPMGWAEISTHCLRRVEGWH